MDIKKIYDTFLQHNYLQCIYHIKIIFIEKSWNNRILKRSVFKIVELLIHFSSTFRRSREHSFHFWQFISLLWKLLPHCATQTAVAVVYDRPSRRAYAIDFVFGLPPVRLCCSLLTTYLKWGTADWWDIGDKTNKQKKKKYLVTKSLEFRPKFSCQFLLSWWFWSACKHDKRKKSLLYNHTHLFVFIFRLFFGLLFYDFL